MFTQSAQPVIPQSQPETTAPGASEPVRAPFSVDQLNQHVLLTVQNINQLSAVVTVRGG